MELAMVLLLAGDIGFACGYWNSLSGGAYRSSLNSEEPYSSPLNQVNDASEGSPYSASSPRAQDERIDAVDTLNVRNLGFPRDPGFGTSVIGNNVFGNSAFGNNPLGPKPFGNNLFGNNAFGNNAFGNNGFPNNELNVASYPGPFMDLPRPPFRPPSITQLCEDFIDKMCKFFTAYFCKNDMGCKRRMKILQPKIGIIGHAACSIL